VKRATKALIKASRFIRENRGEAVKLLIAWGKAKPEHAYAAYDSTMKVISDDGGIPEDGLKLLIEQGKRDAKSAAKSRSAKLPISPVYTRSRKSYDCASDVEN
jgi:ABC-type nitrate/sulfonate/bicarbonate transport system substrate-binding protein